MQPHSVMVTSPAMQSEGKMEDTIEALIERLRKDLADFGGLTANRIYLLNEIKDAVRKLV